MVKVTDVAWQLAPSVVGGSPNYPPRVFLPCFVAKVKRVKLLLIFECNDMIYILLKSFYYTVFYGKNNVTLLY